MKTSDMIKELCNKKNISLSELATNVFEGKECDEEKIKEFINSVLTGIALSNTLIKNRLEVLTSNSPKDF